MPRKRRGGPTPGLTEKVRAQLVTLLESGLSQRAAFGAVGIDESTYYRWLREGRDLQGYGEDEAQALLTAYQQQQRLLYQGVEKATRALEQRLITRLQDIAVGAPQPVPPEGQVPGAPPVWQAIAWFLERRFPDRWGRATRFDLPADIHERAAALAQAAGLDPKELEQEALAIARELYG